MNNLELAARVSQELFNEAVSGKKELAAISEAEAAQRYKNRDISTADDKRLIFRGSKLNEFNNKYEDIKLGIFAEAVGKYVMKALPFDEAVKSKIKLDVFNALKEYLGDKIAKEPAFMENLAMKTCLLERLIDKVNECCNAISVRNLREADGAEEIYTDPVTLLTDEEDNIISTDNTSTEMTSAEDIHEIITNKVIAVIEDENARAEEDELIIADIKANVSGEDAEAELAVSEALAANRGSLFNKLINESQIKRIEEKGLNEGTGEDQSDLALTEAIIRYTISETLYTLRIHEPTSKTEF